MTEASKPEPQAWIDEAVAEMSRKLGALDWDDSLLHDAKEIIAKHYVASQPPPAALWQKGG